jgi:hypothetical protein
VVVLQVTSFSVQRDALCSVELTKRGAYAAPGIFIIGHPAEEGDARSLQGLCGWDGVDGVVEWCAQVHDDDVRGVLLWKRSDLLLWKKASSGKCAVCGESLPSSSPRASTSTMAPRSLLSL